MTASLIPCKRIRIIQENLGKKPRSVHYLLARKALFNIVDLGVKRLDLKYVVKHFENWRSHYQDKFIHMFDFEEDKHIFVKSVSRFDSEYKKKLKSRMRKMKDVSWCLKLEVTLDPKQFLGLYDEFIYLPRLWNSVNGWLKYKFGDLEFLRILEITKKGRPHLHILLIFHNDKWNKYFRSMSKRRNKANFDEFYYEFKDFVSRNGGGFVWVKPIHNKNLKLVNYVLKYVNKSINYENNLGYSALLFASNKRLFSVSRGLRVFGDPEKVKTNFRYVGLVSSNDLLTYCKEKNIPFGFSVHIESLEYKDYYEYSDLFGVKNV